MNIEQGELRPVHPWVMASTAYLHLIERLTPHPYDGLKKLYLYAQGYNPNSVQPDDQAFIKDGVSTALGDTYLNSLITSNIASFLAFLDSLIKARLEESKAESITRSAWVNHDKTPRSFYSPSGFLARRLSTLSDAVDNFQTHAVIKMIADIGLETDLELQALMGNSGYATPHARCDEIILRFLSRRLSLTIMDDINASGSYRTTYLPLLRIYIGLSRLVTGSVAAHQFTMAATDLSTEIKSLHISDSTLAALPPMIGFNNLRVFDEPNGPMISPKGLIYLSKIQLCSDWW